MFIYKFKNVEVEWTDGEVLNDFVDVVAKNYSHAISKMEKCALSLSKSYKDDTGKKISPKKIVDIESVERGDYVDC